MQKVVVRSVLARFGVLMAACLGLMLPAVAANSSLEINAGLQRSLILNCHTSLTFGVWFVQSGNREGGATNIRIGPNQPGQLPTLNVKTGRGTSVIPGPGQGECTLSGSSAADGTAFSVSFGETTLNLLAANVLGRNQPANAASLSVARLRFRSLSPQFVGEMVAPKLSNGTASFAVGGDLTIPNNLDASNFGGYNGTLTITVTEQENP